MKQETVQHIINAGIAVLVAVLFIFTLSLNTAGADTLNPRNTTKAVTGVESPTTVALDTNNATGLSGEPALAQSLNRLFILIGHQCRATTTDAQIKTGAGQGSSFWGIRTGGGDFTIDLYDGTTTGTMSNKIGFDVVASTSLTNSGESRFWGEFAIGGYADLTGTGVLVACYR